MAAFATAARGAGVVFSLNAVSFVAVIAVLAAWQRTPPFKSALPSERIFGSMRSGARYLRHSPAAAGRLPAGVSSSRHLPAPSGRCWPWWPARICTKARWAMAC